MPWLQSSKGISNGIQTRLDDGSGTDRMVVVGSCEIVCFTLSISSAADVIASSAPDQPLVLSETFTNPETIHDPVS
jgi:hypothetical protein